MTDKEALKRIAEKLRRAGASLPAPEVTGTIEGSVVTGLCIALALVETEIEALAQPEQEPVAWMKANDTEWSISFFEEDGYVPLFTTPPQRKPLTDEQIEAIAKNYALGNPTTPLHFVRAIEAAHGIKGE